MKKIIIFLLFLTLIPIASAKPLHTTLLAAQELNGTLVGSTADAFLEIQDGRGRVFLETFPLTKIDTQISTRFAKEISCNYFDIDCSNADFIYTIRSNSVIIGGPSAGAAIAVLTTAGLLDLEMDESVAVTGTINSGGLIGPVGGLKAKIDAAANADIQKVLIPIGTRMYNESNESIDLIEYGQQKSVEVIEVIDLNEVVQYFTGQQILESNKTFTIHPEYTEIMGRVSEQLCSRSRELNSELSKFTINQTIKQDILNKTVRASQAAQEQSYYAAASYCFGLNVQLRTLLYEKQNTKDIDIRTKAAKLQSELKVLEQDAREQRLDTIADLQTLSIVLDRLQDAQRYLDELKNEESIATLALAEERLFSAHAWSEFFAMSGSKIELNDERLEQSCIEKIQEAKEREQYVQLFLGNIGHITEGIERATGLHEKDEFVQCLIAASEAKAEANAILSTIGVEQDQLPRLIETKKSAIQTLVARTIDKGAFPILGVSYYEYASSLQQYDVHSALLYSEYALELSNLDIYFDEYGTQRVVDKKSDVIPFIAGIIVGLTIAGLLFFVHGRKKR